MSAISDPRELLDQSPMNRVQIGAVVICILLNALDGFDVLAISFASPGIAAEWSISRTALGVVLAMELFGMALGSIALGGVADRIGRRPTILFCLALMTVGMYCASLVNSVNQLLLARFFTGLGIGGMLASITAMVAEFSNARYRNLAVIVMSAGYPIGAILGGLASTWLLTYFDWRMIFVFGAAWSGFFLVIVWFGLPESIDYLLMRRPRNALARLNVTLRKMGHETLQQLAPLKMETKEASSYRVLLSPRFRPLTLLLMLGYFTHIMTFYYILKWIPKIVVDMGYDAPLAGTVLVWANVGGALGAIVLGLVATRVPLRGLLTAVLILASVMVSLFGVAQDSLARLSLVAAMTGFFTNAGVVGFYALMANTFPPESRASGTGLVIGMGRGGAALGPIVAGILFTSGFDLLVVSIVMGFGAAVAAAAVYALGLVQLRRNTSSGI